MTQNTDLSSQRSLVFLARPVLIHNSLTTQNTLVNNTLGFKLHPKIDRHLQQLPTSEPRNIIDLGAGNCIWLLSLARKRPTYNFTGVDIDGNNFPLKSHRPCNVELYDGVDVFGPVPERMKNKFDVVHVRDFGLVIKRDDPEPLLRNLEDLLKPGGWLQWDEVDAGAVRIIDSGHCGMRHVAQILKKWLLYSNMMGLQFDWIERLATHVQHAGLELVDRKIYTCLPELSKIWADSTLLGLEHVLPKTAAFDKDEFGTKKEAMNDLREAEKEIQAGKTCSCCDGA